MGWGRGSGVGVGGFQGVGEATTGTQEHFNQSLLCGQNDEILLTAQMLYNIICPEVHNDL